ncbi:MAG: glycosyltransferase, partial [bacterium]|nr:glycosyltransferase [bacterium]
MSSLTKQQHRVGIIGSGFIARGLALALRNHPRLTVSFMLTRRDPATVGELPVDAKHVTREITVVIRDSDIVVECSGDVIHGTDMIEQVLAAGLPVVTMNSELQTVSGTILARRGTLVEAQGDQPGSLAALDAEVRSMGFVPTVYGNIKRFLNLNPTKDEMDYWAKRQGISLDQVTAFTDGTKVQIEQALVANALGATIACRNLSGIPCKAVEDGASRLGEIAESIGRPISDYVLCPTGPAGMFIVARHDEAQKPYLEYLKLGAGPQYVIIRPYHLCHLEIPKTILDVLAGTKTWTFNNGQRPTIQVVAVAKRPIKAGERLERGLGSFTARGEAVKITSCPDGVPIGLLQNATFVRPVAEGRIVTFADVELPRTTAGDLWSAILAEVVPSRSNVSPRVESARISSRRKRLSVSVGIPAHNEEANIAHILESVIGQERKSFDLERMIVLCDGCTDRTVERAREFAETHPIVTVVADDQRLGKSARLNQLYTMNGSDILVTFDADISLEGTGVIDALLRPFADERVAVVAGPAQAFPGRTFVGKVAVASDALWSEARMAYRGGQNIFCSTGSAFALRKSFAQSFRYPKGTIADQQFLYLEARRLHREFRCASDAVVRFSYPDNLREFLFQGARFLS